MSTDELAKHRDPLKLAKVMWPDTYFYREEREMFESVWRDDETIVPAANKQGKDFTAGRIVVLYFIMHYPCRIITTSAKDDHLRVIWGEIGQAIATSKISLLAAMGGPLITTHHEIKRRYKGTISPLCYVKGMVASTDTVAALQGHHAKYTLFVSDESSGVPDEYFKMANGWAKRKLIIGNTWDCANYFYRAVEGDESMGDPGGDIEDPDHPGRYYRKVIHIPATSSPNVRLGLAQKARGEEPSNEILVDGVMTYGEYVRHCRTMDPLQQSVSLAAKFYKGAEIKLFPQEPLKRSVILARDLGSHIILPSIPINARTIYPLLDMINTKYPRKKRRAQAMGVDSAEGNDDTVWTIVDRLGIIYQLAVKTADTANVPTITVRLMREFGLDGTQVFFDRGGGGKQHVDQLRKRGFEVRAVGFGEAPTDPHKVHKTGTIKAPKAQRLDDSDSKYAYKNRRAELYGLTSVLICGESGFAIPAEYKELLRQLKAIPKKYDNEGRLYMLPKDKPSDSYTGKTLKQILGRSPDQADSLALAVYGMMRKPNIVVAGAG